MIAGVFFLSFLLYVISGPISGVYEIIYGDPQCQTISSTYFYIPDLCRVQYSWYKMIHYDSTENKVFRKYDCKYSNCTGKCTSDSYKIGECIVEPALKSSLKYEFGVLEKGERDYYYVITEGDKTCSKIDDLLEVIIWPGSCFGSKSTGTSGSTFCNKDEVVQATWNSSSECMGIPSTSKILSSECLEYQTVGEYKSSLCKLPF